MASPPAPWIFSSADFEKEGDLITKGFNSLPFPKTLL